jgi:hypothetical protein
MFLEEAVLTLQPMSPRAAWHRFHGWAGTPIV